MAQANDPIEFIVDKAAERSWDVISILQSHQERSRREIVKRLIEIPINQKWYLRDEATVKYLISERQTSPRLA